MTAAIIIRAISIGTDGPLSGLSGSLSESSQKLFWLAEEAKMEIRTTEIFGRTIPYLVFVSSSKNRATEEFHFVDVINTLLSRKIGSASLSGDIYEATEEAKEIRCVVFDILTKDRALVAVKEIKKAGFVVNSEESIGIIRTDGLLLTLLYFDRYIKTKERIKPSKQIVDMIAVLKDRLGEERSEEVEEKLDELYREGRLKFLKRRQKKGMRNEEVEALADKICSKEEFINLIADRIFNESDLEGPDLDRYYGFVRALADKICSKEEFINLIVDRVFDEFELRSSDYEKISSKVMDNRAFADIVAHRIFSKFHSSISSHIKGYVTDIVCGREFLESFAKIFVEKIKFSSLFLTMLKPAAEILQDEFKKEFEERKPSCDYTEQLP